MNYRKFGPTGWQVSEIGLGTWQVGGCWGSGFDDQLADRILNEAIDLGVNFIDTADVYENRQSEAAVARVVNSRRAQGADIFVATKCGRFLDPHVDEAYTPAAMRSFVEASLTNTGFEVLDLIQLHCPPTPVYYRPEIFEVFDRLKDEGKIRHLGVSVEKVEEGLKAFEFPNVVSVQVIFNPLRQRPVDLLFPRAQELGRAILVRVPLASGLLSGKFGPQTTFDPDDHRFFNRNGEAFDKGETFAGVPYDLGLEVVNEIETILPPPLAQSSLRWILDHQAVSTVIPGASGVEHVSANVAASSAPPIDPDAARRVRDLYERRVRKHVHHLW